MLSTILGRIHEDYASILAVSLSMALGAFPALAREGVIIKPVVISDQPVPGLSGVTFGNLTWESTNNPGQTLFQSTLNGNGITTSNDTAQWLWDGSNYATVAREGAQAPGNAVGVTFRDIYSVVLNDAGQVQMYARLQGPGVGFGADEMIWKGPPDQLAIIARRNIFAGGTAGNFDIIKDATSIGATGTSAFLAHGGGGEVGNSSDGIWVSSDETLSRLAKTGAPAPGTTSTFRDLGIARISAQRDIVFFSQPATGGAGFWYKGGASSQVEKLAAAGDPASDVEAGAAFSGVTVSLQMNSVGVVIIQGGLSGPGITSDNNYGIWMGRPGALQLVARRGDESPGLPSTLRLAIGATSPTISDNGRVAFRSSLMGSDVTSANDYSVWTGSPGSLHMIAREGDPAPQTSPGTLYSFVENPTVSPSGRVTFLGTLIGPDVTSANSVGLWQYTPQDGIVHLLARTGDPVEISSGVFRTIQSIAPTTTFSSPEDFTFSVAFTDGTKGILTASVPEPAALASLTLCIALLPRPRRINKQQCRPQTPSW